MVQNYLKSIKLLQIALGVFSLSRSFGDIIFKLQTNAPAEKRLMSAYPEVRRHPLTGDEEFLVIACDGIFVLSGHEACSHFFIRDLGCCR